MKFMRFSVKILRVGGQERDLLITALDANIINNEM